jgi:hypothetical protein
MLGVYAILQFGGEGAASTQTLALGGLSVALLGAFVARQHRVATPLMPLRLFRSRAVTGGNGVQALLVVGMFAMFFLGALYLQQILHYDAFQVGLAFLPATLAMGTASLRLSEPLSARLGPLTTLLAGLLAITGALLLFARTPTEASYPTDILPPMVLLGLGAGLGFPALTTVAMSGATDGDSRLASGLVNTSLNVGGAIGLAVLSAFAAERSHSLLADGVSTTAALNSGYHLAYLISAALVVLAIALAVATLRTRTAPAAHPQLEGCAV